MFLLIYAVYAVEITAVQQYKNALVLDNASRFVFHLNRMPRLNMRLECHEIAFAWSANAGNAETQLNILQRACAEMTTSEAHLKTILAAILSIGNYINGDSNRGQVNTPNHSLVYCLLCRLTVSS